MNMIWNLGPGHESWPQNMKIIRAEYVNNGKVQYHIIFIFIQYLFHIILTCWDPGPGPRLGPRSSKCETNMKIIWNIYTNHVSLLFLMIFRFVSYYFHILFTCWGSGPRWERHFSYYFHIPGHILSYELHIIGIPHFPVFPYGQSLQQFDSRSRSPLQVIMEG